MASRLLRTSVKATAATYDRIRPPADGVVILLYHRVGGGSSSRVDLPTTDFRDQMTRLAGSGRAVSLDDAVAILDGRIPAPHPRPVVVTFDDGTADLVDHAFPLLAAVGIPSTLYLATRWVEDGVPFWGEGPALSWQALRDATSTGLVTVGSHTHDHVLLDRADAIETTAQIDRSVGLIEDHLGATPAHFAYPKALAPSPAALGVVRQRFRSAALAGTRPNPIGASDLHRLGRTPIQAEDEPRWFEHKVAGGLGLEDRLRSHVDRVRYRNAAR